MLSTMAWAGYGILVNGCEYYAGTKVGDNDGFQQYLSHVTIKKGDYCQLYDIDNQAAWVVTLDTYSEKGFTKAADRYNCTVDGCFDFYIKLKYQQDQLYIGNGSNCGEPQNLCPTTGFYIAGNGVADNPWCCGLSWDSAGCPLGETNERTFANVPAGEYKFKVTNGTWKQCWGGAAVDASKSTTGYVTDGDGNAVFTTAAMADITISFDGKKIVLTSSQPFAPTWTGSVPGECLDVMLQGFFYDSYEVDSAHLGTLELGDTRWTTLQKQAGELGAWFDWIWLPPSGLANGTGYHPRQYSNQNSDWGTRAELQTLINSLHQGGAKVAADIVINHIEAMATWCDFSVQNFGTYGTFAPDGSWICEGDEMNWPEYKADTLAGECWGTATGNADDGENWEGARDWSHDMPKVQEMFKAYLQWLRNEIGYDGWRYDKGDGFNNWHMWNYNQASKPQMAFMECWKGNTEIIWHINEGKKDILAFDFQNMYLVYKNDGIQNGKFSNCGINGKEDWGDGAGLVQEGYKKNAVTFIDNHDMFRRGNQEFCGDGNSLKPQNKTKLLQANAHMLSMPGVPCVFYPHWYTYKAEIKDMINARRVAGVHSESVVQEEEVSQGGYKATVLGKNGKLIVTLGDKTIQDATGANKWLAENNYKKLASGTGYALWVKADKDVASRIIATPDCAFEDSINGIKVGMRAVGGSGVAAIYYTIDGTEPTDASAVYNDSLNFTKTTVLKAIAVTNGIKSQTYTYTYTYREPLKRGIQVHFNKPELWDKVYYYAWQPGVDSLGQATSTNLMGAYPGQRIYRDVDGWYSWEFDQTVDSVNFCISSGDECGGLNVRSSDLIVDYDSYFEWEEGFETESKHELKLEEPKELNPEFDIEIAPEEGFFRDSVAGEQITISIVGKKGATIYYTTDGSDPATCANPSIDSVSFRVKETSMVQAYAFDLVSKERTETKTVNYTYKAPQQGALEIKFFKPKDWKQVYLYAFTRVKIGTKNVDTPYPLEGKKAYAKWPGMPWTTFDVKDTDSVYYYTMDDKLKDIYIIFNIGSNRTQTQDIYLTENTCYVWNADCRRAVVNPKCDGKLPTDVEDILLQPAQQTDGKFIVNGELYIRVGETIYDIFGRIR